MQNYSSILKTENVISRGIPRLRSPCFLGPKNPQNICPTNKPTLVAFICMLSFKSNIQLGCILSQFVSDIFLVCEFKKNHLVGGFNPFEKYSSNGIISPNRGENQKNENTI